MDSSWVSYIARICFKFKWPVPQLEVLVVFSFLGQNCPLWLRQEKKTSQSQVHLASLMGPGTTREGSSPVAGFVTIRVRTGDGLDEPKMTCLSFVLPGCLGETTRFFGRILWTGHTSFFWPLLQVTAKCWSCCCRPFSRISCTVQVLSSLANLLACKIPGPKLWLATWSPQAVFDVWGVSNYADFWVIDKNVPWYFSIDTGQLACHVCVAGSKASS